jgi:hypothetical protein
MYKCTTPCGREAEKRHGKQDGRPLERHTLKPARSNLRERNNSKVDGKPLENVRVLAEKGEHWNTH